MTKSGKSKRREDCIVVLGGSFSPLHSGHLAALDTARQAAEERGFRVVAGYLAVAHDAHVNGKFRGRGEDRDLAFGVEDRLHMCNSVAAGCGWMRPTPRAFGSAQECGRAMVALNHPQDTRIIKARSDEWCGALHKTADGTTISSTFVRKSVRSGGVAALDQLAASNVLPGPVVTFMRPLLEGSKTAKSTKSTVHESLADDAATGDSLSQETAEEAVEEAAEPEVNASAHVTAPAEPAPMLQPPTAATAMSEPSAASTAVPEPPLPPVIFLDINGVLRKLTAPFDWDDKCVAALLQVVETTGARIVLSSSWRKGSLRLNKVRELLGQHSLQPLLGATPVLGREHSARGDEILQWLEANGGVARPWVAIDDGPLHVKQYQRNVAAVCLLSQRHVRTDSTQGLTVALAKAAIDCLDGGKSKDCKVLKL